MVINSLDMAVGRSCPDTSSCLFSEGTLSVFAFCGCLKASDVNFFLCNAKRVGEESCFSNLYISINPIVDAEGLSFQTCEHFIMHRKARLFDDEEAGEAVLRAPTPETAKWLGLKVRNFRKDVWHEIRGDVVYQALELKFKQDGYALTELFDSKEKFERLERRMV